MEPTDKPNSSADLPTGDILALLQEVAARRQSGKELSDEVVCAAHPELMPALGEHLRYLSMAGQAHDAFETMTAERPRQQTQLPDDSIPGCSIVREIHRGGQGVVYQAIQKTTRRKVAIKVMREGPFASQRDKARFEREVQILAALKHPNIVAIHESGMAAGSFYFVMDYISGQPLDAYMAAGRRSVRETLAIFQKVCEAVNAAHLRGVIHRDLKPGNIRIDPQDEPQILDFGLAKVAPGQIGDESVSMTQTGQFVGSLPWASPEQAEGIPAKIDIRTDVYSLGVILYHMLTRQFPYDVVGGFRDVLDRIMTAPPVPPRTVRAEIDDEVETIVLKCLQKERERRYQSAGELARDIGHYLAGEPIEAKRDSALYVLRKHLRHYKAPIAAGVVFVLLLAGFAITMSIQAQRNRRLARSEFAAREEAVAQKRAADRERDVARTAEDKATERAEQLRRALYLNRIALARQAYETGDISRANEYLYSSPADLRGWEWYWLVETTDQSRLTIRGHLAWINAVACSPDGKWIASGGADGFLMMWDAATGRRIQALSGHTSTDTGLRWPSTSGVCTVAFSSNGARLVSGSEDKTLKIWDAAKGKELKILRGHEGTVASAAFGPDGTRVLSGSHDKTVKVWDSLAGAVIITLTGHKAPVTSVAFGADGNRMASASSDGQVKIWDAVRYTETHAIDSRLRSVLAIAFSPDNKWLVSGGQDGILKIWDACTGEEYATLPRDGGAVRALAFSPDAKKIVSGNAGGILKIWDTSVKGAQPITLLGHEGGIQSVVWAPDGKQLISGSLDKTVKIWDTSARPNPLILKDHRDSVLTLAVSPDGKRIVSGSKDMTVIIRDAITGSQIHVLSKHRGWVNCVAFSPDGRQIASAGEDGTVMIWDSDLGAEVRTLQGPKGAVRAVAFDPHGRWIVSSHYSGEPDGASLQLWETETGRNIRSVSTGGESQRALAVSRDGERIVAGGWGRKVGIWNAATGREIWTSTFQESPICSAAFSPDGMRFVSGTNEGILTVWNVRTGEKELKFSGNGNWVMACFSPDEPRIVSGGDDGTVKIWHSVSGEELLTLRGHTSGVRSVAIAPDQSFIVSGGADGTLRIWRSLAKGQLGKDPAFASRLLHGAASLVSRGMLDEARPLVAEATTIRLALRGQRSPDFVRTMSDDLLRLVTGFEGLDTPVSRSGQSLLESVPFTEWDVRIFAWSPDEDLLELGRKMETLASGASVTGMKARAIDFDWGHGAPGPNLPADYFGLVATTTVNLRAGVYWLRTISDDGVRVWIDGHQLIDNWTRHARTSDAAMIELKAGDHQIRIEYCEIVLDTRLAFGMWLLAPASDSK